MLSMHILHNEVLPALFHSATVRGQVGNAFEFESGSRQTNALHNEYLSLPKRTIDIIRRGQTLLSSTLGYCDSVGYKVMVLGD